MRSSLEDSRGLDPPAQRVTQGLVARLGRQSEGSSQLENLRMPPSRRCSGPRRKKMDGAAHRSNSGTVSCRVDALGWNRSGQLDHASRAASTAGDWGEVLYDVILGFAQLATFVGAHPCR
jgi:hypothetical protein